MKQKYKFSKTHEWVRVEKEYAYVGISVFAAKKLGEIVYVDMPSVGDSFAQFEEFGAIESVKAASELYAPLSGVVEAINEDLQAAPEKINQQAEQAWIMKIKINAIAELDALLSYEQYIELNK